MKEERGDAGGADASAAAAALEAVMMEHWRTMPSWLVSDREEDHQNVPANTTNKLLLSFLFALRSAGLLLASCDDDGEEELSTPSSSSWLLLTAASTDSGREEAWVEGVRLLFDWVFVSQGPHACLSFLADAADADADADADAAKNQAKGKLAQDKAKLFRHLGPALLWGGKFAPEWEAILPGDELPRALTTLCVRLRQAAEAADCPTALVLLKCLSHVLCFPRMRECKDQRELVVSTFISTLSHTTHPAISQLFLENFSDLGMWLSPSLNEKLQDLIDDTRAASPVREAALKRRIAVGGSYEHRATLFALATDESAPPPLRCAALALMTQLDSDQERLRVIAIALTIAGERQADERLVMAAYETLCHWRVTLDFEMTDLQPFIHRVLLLADNAVRREPDVPTLLDLVSDRIALYQRCGIAWTAGSLASLPEEVQGLLEAKRTKLRNKDIPGRHTKTLRKATQACLLVFAELLEHEFYNLMKPAIVSMMRPENSWQRRYSQAAHSVREGGLLVLGFALQYRGDHQLSDLESMLSFIIAAMNDPKAKVRKIGCRVASAVLREPFDEVGHVAKLLVRLALDDSNPRVQTKALLALQVSDWTWCAEVVLKECHRIHQQGHQHHQSVRALSIIARGVLLLVLWAQANPSANHGLYVCVVQSCLQTLLDGLPSLIVAQEMSASVLTAIRHALSIRRFAGTVDGEYVLACYEDYFNALNLNRLEDGRECILTFRALKLHQPAAMFSHQTATRMVLVAADFLIKRSTELALWALTCIAEEYPDCVSALMDPVVAGLVSLLNGRIAMLDSVLVQLHHCLACGCGVMRAYVRRLSGALVTSTTTMRFDMALRCCLLLVPCGVGDIDGGVVSQLVAASPLSSISCPSAKIKARVSTESLARLVVELFAERRLDECQKPKVVLAVLKLVADRLQRDTHKPASADPDTDAPPPLEPTAAVRKCVEEAVSVLTSKINRHRLQAGRGRERWHRYRQGLKRYLLPAAPALVELLLG